MNYKMKKESAILKGEGGAVLLLKYAYPEFDGEGERLNALYKRLRDKCFECAKALVCKSSAPGAYKLTVDTAVNITEDCVTAERAFTLRYPDGGVTQRVFRDCLTKDGTEIKKRRKVVKNKHLFRNGTPKI